MLFNSLTFLVFFVAVLAVHRLMPTWTARKRFLLIASYFFYASWNPPYVAILLFSTTMDWWFARQIGRMEEGPSRKSLLVASLLVNLGLLGFFKYGGFLLANFQDAAALVGIIYRPPTWNIVLPIGISFYTFASLSYTIDVYRSEDSRRLLPTSTTPCSSVFPASGGRPHCSREQAAAAAPAAAGGNARNVRVGPVAAGNGAVLQGDPGRHGVRPVVERVYGHPEQFGALDTWAAVLGFSGQIYFDFSGYSLCAIGIALTLGFEFPDNFRAPYAARGFSDFWRRWHISLSSWLRDYLYIPLGGNRGDRWRTDRNVMITMLIGGLWHGASWMYVLWGGLHGTYLVAERHLRRNDPPTEAPQHAQVALTLITFVVVTLTWIPFRAVDAHTAATVLTALFRFDVPERVGTLPLVCCLGAAFMMVGWQFALRDSSLEERCGRLSSGTQALILAVCLISLYLWSGGDERAFLYFQF